MNFSTLERQALTRAPSIIAVCGADGDEVYDALKAAQDKGLARFLLVGEPGRCEALSREHGVTPVGIVSAGSDDEAAAQAVRAVADGRAQLLMKGLVSTPTLLKAVVSEKRLFDAGRLLSHVLVVQSPDGRLLGVTDGGMVPQPDLEQKAAIIRNAVDLFHRLGIETPRVAVLAANEKANPRIPGSSDALELKQRGERGEMPGCIIDGPMALDLALSPRAAVIKDYHGAIQGNADILIVHDISSGNHLGKALITLAGYPGGGMVVGARVPIILLSRSDSAAEKYNSILLALAGGTT
jgi:phosphate butyryltransferase